MSKIQVIATGPELLKEGIRAVAPVIEDIIENAKQEIQIVAYVFTYNAGRVLELLNVAAEKGIKVTIILNDFNHGGQPHQKLKDFNRKHIHVNIYDFEGTDDRQLHAKVIVADRSKAIVGSANFSRGGFHINYEIGVLIEGQEAWDIASMIDSLSKGCKKLE